MRIGFEAIGHVISDFKYPKDLIFACERGLKTKTISKIVIHEKYADGLRGLEKFSHVFVIYFLDRAKKLNC